MFSVVGSLPREESLLVTFDKLFGTGSGTETHPINLGRTLKFTGVVGCTTQSSSSFGGDSPHVGDAKTCVFDGLRRRVMCGKYPSKNER